MTDERVNDVSVRRNFKLYEFESPDTHEVKIYNAVISKIQRVRYKIKRAIKITSGYRTEKHNKYVGGEENSQHTIGAAIDISTVGHSTSDLMKYLKDENFEQIILYKEKQFIHCALFTKNPFEKKSEKI